MWKLKLVPILSESCFRRAEYVVHMFITFIISTSIQWEFCCRLLGQIGWASLDQQCMTGITNPYWLWWRRQRQFVVRASITENFPTVSTVVLLIGVGGRNQKKYINKVKSHTCTKTFGFAFYFTYLSLREWEFLFTELTMCCFFVFQPNESLVEGKLI